MSNQHCGSQFHEPPVMQGISPGTYTHICPECGTTTVYSVGYPQ